MPRLHTARCRLSAGTPLERSRGSASSIEAGLRAGAGIALIGATPAHAVVLFGDVREVEEVREAPRNRERGLDRHRPELAGQGLESIRRRDARALGERAHALHPFEERLSLLPPQRLAKELAEQPNVVAQGAVRIRSALSHVGHHLGHGRHSSADARTLTTAPSLRRIRCRLRDPWL